MHALVGTAGLPTRICDECVGLCCEILAEEAGLASPGHVHAPAPPSADDEQFQQRVGEILRRFASEHEAAHRDALLNDLGRALAARGPNASRDDFGCSFCGAHRKDVAKLIAGPRVFICNGCVGDATAVVNHVLRAV